VRRFITQSGIALAFLLGIAGGILLVRDALGRVLFGVAVFLALGFGGRDRWLAALEKMRRYDQVLEQTHALETELRRLKRDNDQLRRAVDRALAVGVSEGKLQILGSALARLSEAPQLLAVSDVDGVVYLVGRYDDVRRPVRVGARFSLEVIITGDRKGVLQVVRVETEERSVYMQPVERTVPEYWDRLEAAAAADPRPPSAVRLVPYEYDPPRGVSQNDALVSHMLPEGGGAE
jgi:hypothetical protein